MPCNGDYLEPKGTEKSLSQVMAFHDELNGHGEPPKKYMEGYHPEAYGKANKNRLDFQVDRLCNRLQDVNVSHCSLELQLWWRDHQRADAERAVREQREKNRNLAEKALAKLTAKERIALKEIGILKG